jgi:hypothetical protein
MGSNPTVSRDDDRMIEPKRHNGSVTTTMQPERSLVWLDGGLKGSEL